jgi:hypothetical protein
LQIKLYLSDKVHSVFSPETLSRNMAYFPFVSAFWFEAHISNRNINLNFRLNGIRCLNFFYVYVEIGWNRLIGRLSSKDGRAIAQAVNRWLSTAAARVRSLVWSSGICGGQSGVGAGFLRVLRFPLPIFIPPIAPQSPSPIICGWYNKPEVAAVQGT